jgi:hypothetical protein
MAHNVGSLANWLWTLGLAADFPCINVLKEAQSMIERTDPVRRGKDYALDFGVRHLAIHSGRHIARPICRQRAYLNEEN